MAKVIRIGRKLARLGGKLVLDTNGAPCCCGGGGGTDCCICGRCWFDPAAPGWTDGEATLSAVVTVTGGGVDSGCCQAFGPSGLCMESEISVPLESLVLPGVLAEQVSPCDLIANGFAEYEIESCDCEFDCAPALVTDGLALRSAVTSRSGCPGFNLPAAGAVVGIASCNEGGCSPYLVIWGGSRCIGPLIMAQFRRVLVTTPGSYQWVNIYAVVGAGGGAAFIATYTPVCGRWPCADGCEIAPRWDEPETWEPFPYRIDGGGTASGVFDCNGSLNIAGNLHAAYTLACRTDTSQTCLSHAACLDTGPFDLDLDFSVTTHLGGLLTQCPPKPDDGTDKDTDPGTRVKVPAAWLAEFPDLKAAVEAIRAAEGDKAAKGGTMPPPGVDANQRAIEGLLGRDPVRRCRGCGDGFTG